MNQYIIGCENKKNIFANGQLIGDNKVVREPKSQKRYGNTVLNYIKIRR